MVTREGATISTFAGQEVNREVTQISWDVRAAEKGGFKHFMLKEIYEQPKVGQATRSPGEIGEDGQRQSLDVADSRRAPAEIQKDLDVRVRISILRRRIRHVSHSPAGAIARRTRTWL